MIYNLCEDMLITHVARPRSPFTPPPPPNSPRDKRSFIRLRGGRMASSCEAKPKWRSALAGVTATTWEELAASARDLLLVSDTIVYVLVRAAAHLLSAYFMAVCENRKLWLASTWFKPTWGYRQPAQHKHGGEGDLNELSTFKSI